MKNTIRLMDKVNQLIFLKGFDMPRLGEIKQVRMDKFGNQYGRLTSGTKVVRLANDKSRVWRDAA